MSNSARDFSGRLPPHLRPINEAPVPDVATVRGGTDPLPAHDTETEQTLKRYHELMAARPAPVNIPKARFPLPDGTQAKAKLVAARRALADAIEVRDARQRQCDSAVHTLDCGRESASDLQNRVEAANGIDDDIAHFLADHVNAELPANLIERRAERDRVSQKHRDALAAVSVLEQHAGAARAHLQAAESAVQDRIQDVLAAHLDGIAARLLAAEGETLRHRQAIIDMADAGAKLSPATKQSLLETRPSADRSAPVDRTARLQHWRDVIARLAVDAGADIMIDI